MRAFTPCPLSHSWPVYGGRETKGWIVHADGVHKLPMAPRRRWSSDIIMSESSVCSVVSHGVGDRPMFLVGQDAEGHWLAVEQHGRGGGIFVSKDAALRYVGFETAHAPGACRLASEPVGLRFSEGTDEIRKAA